MGCFLLIRHCKLSIFFPFKFPVCLRIKPWVSPLAYGLDNRGGTFLVFFNTYKHTICRTHIIVNTMIKEPRSWQDSMILFRVFFQFCCRYSWKTTEPAMSVVVSIDSIDHRRCPAYLDRQVALVFITFKSIPISFWYHWPQETGSSNLSRHNLPTGTNGFCIFGELPT